MGVLSDLLVKLRLDNKQYNSELKESGNKTSGFGKGVAKIGGLIAGAFAVSSIVSFGKELLQLGGIAEGVRSAFNRIADDRVLDGLRDATKGTVGDLELMKRAVSANQLGLPIENLASLFEFATKRAQETGDSVDFLVNSIVTGIGRKSPLILDNLGISAIQLREKLKGVGMETASVADVAKAVGDIAADAMRESGDIIDTNTVKLGQIKTAWENWKLEISESDLVLEFFSESLKEIIALSTIFTSKSVSTWGKVSALLFDSREEFLAIAKAIDDANASADEMGPSLHKIEIGIDGVIPKFNDATKSIEDQRKEWDALNKAYTLGVDRINAISDASIRMNKQLMEAAAASDAFFEAWTKKPDVSGIVGGGGVFDMFDNETGEDLGFDTEGYAMKLEETQAFVDEMNSIMANGMADFISVFAEGIGQLASGNISFDQFFDSILSQIGGFLIQFGSALIAYGIASEAFTKAFSNPYVAIAAGAALVAIGGLISGMGSKGPAGFSGSSGGGGISTGSFSADSTGSQEIDNKVVFELQGTKLVGVLANTGRRNSIIG